MEARALCGTLLPCVSSFCVDVSGTACHREGKHDAGALSHGCSRQGIPGGLHAAGMASRVLWQCHWAGAQLSLMISEIPPGDSDFSHI